MQSKEKHLKCTKIKKRLFDESIKEAIDEITQLKESLSKIENDMTKIEIKVLDYCEKTRYGDVKKGIVYTGDLIIDTSTDKIPIVDFY